MIIKACVNGARRLSDHPRLSTDPRAVAAEARAAAEAGAIAIHVHPKNPQGLDSLDALHVTAFIEAVRVACPGVPVGITTGAWATPDVTSRVDAIRAWPVLPDFASVNRHEDGADDVATELLNRGVDVEAGIWHERGLSSWRTSPLRGSCLRVLIELGDCGSCDADTFVRDHALPLIEGVRDLEPNVPILLHAEEGSTWAAIDLAAHHGLDTRVGLEDTVRMPDGRPARGNADLVQEALRRATALPRRQ